MSAKLRLHQYLSKTGKFSNKSQIWDSIKGGLIKVDGEVIQNPQFQIKKSAFVLYKNKKMELISDVGDQIYLLFNKPAGFLCSKLSGTDVALGKKSIFSFIQSLKTVDENTKRTLFCVGRLDEDTSGLIIITNDGDLSHKITSPESFIKKKYYANLKLPLSHSDIKKIEKGISISLEENGTVFSYTTKPCDINLSEDGLSCEISVTEGKKREIRRIFEAVGNEVLKLKRTAIGGLVIDELNIKEGEFLSVDKDFVNEKLF